MPPPRPRGFANSSGISGNRPSPSTPMSERQQMALLMQMTSASPACSSDVHQSLSNLNQLATRPRDRNERGETSLHVAAIRGDQDTVKKLIESGINPNVLDFAGWSPLHEACSHGYYNIAFALIKAGANVNAKGLDDDTPLHDAAVNGNLKLVKLLIEKGADLFAKNRKGRTPTDVAASSISTYLSTLRDVNLNKSINALKKGVLSDLRKSIDAEDISNVDNCEIEDDNPIMNLKRASNNDDGKSQSKTKVDKTIQKDEYNEEDTANKLASYSSNTPVKRSHSDVEMDEFVDAEDLKRKKRKDSENVKDSSKASISIKSATRNDKNIKHVVVLPKLNTAPLKISSERKSPCVSPKPPALVKTHDIEVETEDTKNFECFSGTGPKVPPLKIVIPQQNCASDTECGSRSGKVSSVRNQIAHPYVVSSSNSNDSLSADKETSQSRCNSPTEGMPNKNGVGNTTNNLQEEKSSKIFNEEKGQQRILRSSNRSGGQTIDRSSNNSSPQLQSSSNSPATLIDVNDKNTNLSNNSLNLQMLNPPLESESNLVMSGLGNISSPSIKDMHSNPVELHPRKRKIKTKHEEHFVKNQTIALGTETNNIYDNHPHDHPFTNCYHMYLNIRAKIEKKHGSLLPIKPRPPQGFVEYLMNRRSYLLETSHTTESCPIAPKSIPTQMIDLFASQERERHKLKLKHIVEKEKLGLTVEQEILRVHGKAARSLACQSVPFSVCTFLKDEEVYNLITPEQEEKDRNARSRYNGRLFISWLQDVDDKWEKIKEAMVLRHHNEAESLHALQRMDWNEVLKENDLCNSTSNSCNQEDHVPMVHVSDDFELLPA